MFLLTAQTSQIFISPDIHSVDYQSLFFLGINGTCVLLKFCKGSKPFGDTFKALSMHLIIGNFCWDLKSVYSIQLQYHSVSNFSYVSYYKTHVCLCI